MANIKLKGGIPLTDNAEVTVPKFNFSELDPTGRTRYHNNPELIDFVTYEGALYVCLVEGATASEGKPGANFLKLVDRGPEGPRGRSGADGTSPVMPRIGANFINDQLKITVNDKTVAVSPSLTGPTWKPVRDGNILTWELTDDRLSPEDIDLMELRPVDKCPLLLRTNSDNTKRSDEVSGPANFIQWKYEGDKYWTNLISISELMNLALCGICFWYDESDGEWHFGNKEVVKATYQSDKNGRKIVSRVELGDVLFDAGSIPINDYGADIDLIYQSLRDLESRIPDLDGYATEDWVNAQGFLKEVPEVDAYTKAESDARFQPKGRYVKSVNGEIPDDNGNVTITVGDLDLTDYVKKEDLVKINNHFLYKPAGSDFTIDPGTSGMSDVEFRVNSDKLQYRKKNNNTWGSWTDIMDVPEGGSQPGTSEHVTLSIHDGKLWISYNGSAEQEVGEVNGGSSTPGSGDTVNGFVDVAFDNSTRKLTFTRQDGTTKFVTIPSNGSSEGGACDHCWTEEEIQALIDAAIEALEIATGSQVSIQRVLNSGTKIATITIDGVSTDIYAPTSTGGSTVAFEQILGSGTKIGTITIDGTATDIYAPNGTTPGPDDPDDPTPGGTVSYRTFMVYQRTGSPTEAPATNTITAAQWNLNTNELVLTSEYWTNHPGNATGREDYCLWMTSASFRSDTGARDSAWEDPICLTSIEGDGADSNRKEFIYRSVTEAEYLVVKEVRPVGAYDTDQDEENDNYDDNIPGEDNLAERQWTDVPVGISPEYPYELSAVRKRVDGVWGQYSMPYVWSHWGDDGVDGAGVEYVFRRAVASEVVEANNSVTLNQNVTRPDNAWAYDSPVAPWTDEPSGVNSDYRYEFCSMRKTARGNDSDLHHTQWTNWSEPALWSIYKEGPQGPIGPDGDSVTVTDQQRYYKASSQATGITAPNINADPTLPANGSWLTTSNSMQLDENNPYLWFFERITYSNGNKWQSDPVVIRYFNSAVNVDYEEIERNVLDAIDGDLADLDERLSKVVDTNGDVIVDGENGLVSIITNYKDENQTSFADMIANAAEAKIKNFAGSAVADGLGRETLTSVKNELDGIEGRITNAATQARQGAVNDARTEWSAADATITSTATKATYVWEDEDGVIHEYTDEDVTANVSSKTVGGKTYTRKLVAEAMSAIKQESDKVSIIVGQDGNVKADIIVEAINETTGGSTVQIDADHIILNGDAVANAINAKYANVGGGAVVLDANGLQATGANIEGTITASAGTFGGNNGVKITNNGVVLGSDCSISWDSITDAPSGGSDVNPELVTKINQWSIESDTIIANNLKAKNIDAEYLTVGGNPIDSSNRLNIEFANGSLPANPDPNTIYFLY